jgi:hypothetical protein
MERIINRFAVAALLLAATTGLTRGAHAQSSRGDHTSSSSSSRFDKTTDARDLTTGLSLGIYSLVAPGVSFTGADVDGSWHTKLGEGAGLVAAYGFNRTFSAFVSLDLAKQETGEDVVPAGSFGLAHFEIGGRLNLPMNSARTTPYLSASVGQRALAAQVTDEKTGDTFPFSMSGQMFAVGAGVEHFMSPHLALDAGVEYATGSFKHFKDDWSSWDANIGSSTSLRLRVGANWRP